MKSLLPSACLLVGFTIIASPATCAQDADGQTSAAVALPRLLEIGQEVKVSIEGGGSATGTVVSVSAGQLVIAQRQYPYPYFRSRVQRTFTNQLIRGVDAMDSVWNGLLLGAAAATAYNAVWIEKQCSPSCDDEGGKTERWIIGTAVFVPIGMAIGAVIDRQITKPIYRRASATPRVGVAPQFDRRRKGIVVAFRF